MVVVVVVVMVLVLLVFCHVCLFYRVISYICAKE